jgi:hypothetical protein
MLSQGLAAGNDGEDGPKKDKIMEQAANFFLNQSRKWLKLQMKYATSL